MAIYTRVRFMDRTSPPHLFTLILAAGTGALAMNVFLPSLPDIADHFDADYRVVQLSVAAYLLVSAALHLVVGPASDRFGRRPVMLFGFAVFLLATLGCLAAPNFEAFLAMRMVQAFAVVGMVLGRAVIRDTHSPNEAASAIGYVTMGMALAPMLGPVIGGFLGSAFGWQASFWLLAAGGAAALAVCHKDLGETIASRSGSLGEQARQYPDLLASPRFWGYCLCAAFAAGAFFAFLGGAPYVGSEVYGLSPGRLGVYFGAPTLGYFVGNWISGRHSARFGINAMILAGAAIVTVGMAAAVAVFSAGPGSAGLFFGFMLAVGLGNGLVMPNAQAGLLSVRPHLAGSASGLGGAITIGGGAFLAALAGTLLKPGSGPAPLVWIMFATSVLSLAAILFVIRRARRLGIGGEA